ncbi:MAG: hypothetical protein JWM95_4250, partial [Gemmatimonadetes bacterium]|nr:hypothetical protein [Gemmatimonadota bacterium]
MTAIPIAGSTDRSTPAARRLSQRVVYLDHSWVA